MVPRWWLFGYFLRPVFSARRAQHVSDLHSKFTLRPHHVWKYGRHSISDRWDEARKKRRRKKKPQDENIVSASAMQGGHNKLSSTLVVLRLMQCLVWKHWNTWELTMRLQKHDLYMKLYYSSLHLLCLPFKTSFFIIRYVTADNNLWVQNVLWNHCSDSDMLRHHISCVKLILLGHITLLHM